MNAVVATPAAEITVTCEPTAEYPRALVVYRSGDWLHVTVLVHNTIPVACSQCWNNEAFLKSDEDGVWRLVVGDGAFRVTLPEVNKLRDELQLPVRSST